MNKRIEKIRNDYNTLIETGHLHYNSDDIKWLIDVAESAIMTRNMLKACIGKPIDDTATIFLDKAFEGDDDG